MNMSKNLKTNNGIINAIKECTYLFSHFDNVYLFGSILNEKSVSNDIDILLIYSEYSDEINIELEIISKVLKNECEIPVHFTVLSACEELEVKLIQRINLNCLKLK